MENSTIYCQLLINGVLIGGIYALLSVGLALIFGVIEVINFAHGEVLMVGMYLAFIATALLGLNYFLAMAVALVIFFVFGALVQKTIIEPILHAPPFSQIFATVGLAYILKNVALLIFNADIRSLDVEYLKGSILAGPFFIDRARFIAFLLSIVALIILLVFLKKTYLGKAISAVSQERRGALLRGINVRKTYTIAMGIGFVCTGLAGFSLAAIYSVYPTVGSAFGMIAFVVVILGGYNNLAGVFVGAFIIGLLESFSGFFLSVHLKEVVYFIAFIIILIIKPTGLFGGSNERKFKRKGHLLKAGA